MLRSSSTKKSSAAGLLIFRGSYTALILRGTHCCSGVCVCVCVCVCVGRREQGREGERGGGEGGGATSQAHGAGHVIDPTKKSLNSSPRLRYRSVINSAAGNAKWSDPCGALPTCPGLFERGGQPLFKLWNNSPASVSVSAPQGPTALESRCPSRAFASEEELRIAFPVSLDSVFEIGPPGNACSRVCHILARESTRWSGKDLVQTRWQPALSIQRAGQPQLSYRSTHPK